jgi:PGF-pre-PGF domain-containing protein
MPKSRRLCASSSYRRKLGEKLRKDSRKPWRITCNRACIVFTVCSLLLSLCEPVVAGSFPPAPPQHIVVEETCISVSLTTPASTVFINVTEYDAKQIVKNVTIAFCEPVTYVSFTLKVLSKRPSYVSAIKNSTVLQYHAITFLTGVNDETANVAMDFAIEKEAKQEKAVDEETLVLYRYDGKKMEECPTEKFEEDDVFLYFKTKTEGLSYVAVTGGVVSSPWWFALVMLAVAALIAVIGIYVYRRFKLANLRKMLRAWYGK